MRLSSVRFLHRQCLRQWRSSTVGSHFHVSVGPLGKKVDTKDERGGVRRSVAAMGMQFCRECGFRMMEGIPPGDTRRRWICPSCGYVDYQNPKLVVGCIVEHENRILLCSRGIQPCKGLWTLPAGYLEIGESMASGAARETMEEANASVSIVSMFSMMDVPIIGQCHVMFRAALEAPYHHSPGPETIKTKLVRPDEIDLDEIAFTSLRETIKAYRDDWLRGEYRFHHGVIVRRPKATPNDPAAYTLENYVAQ